MSRERLPRKFGKYELIRRIAQGGMAELFLARKDGPAGTEKDVAIKRILPHYASSEEFIALFLNEARVAAMLNHASVVRIYDLGRAEGTLFIAMEYVDGVNLRDVGRMLRRMGRLMPPAIAAAIGARAAEALDYAHRLSAPGGALLKLVHRDISADNILLTRDGYVKLVDFGIAKAVAMHPLTRTQGLKGKVNYLSPEQIVDIPLDGRCDLYALGVTLYLLTTAHFPYGGTNDVEVINLILSAALVRPSSLVPGIPKAFEEIVVRLLAKDREQRFPDGADAALALQAFARDAGATLTARELAEYLKQVEDDDRAIRATQPETPLAEPPSAVPPWVPLDSTVDDSGKQPAATLEDEPPRPAATVEDERAVTLTPTAPSAGPGAPIALALGIVLLLAGGLALWLLQAREPQQPPLRAVPLRAPLPPPELMDAGE